MFAADSPVFFNRLLHKIQLNVIAGLFRSSATDSISSYCELTRTQVLRF